MSKQKEFICEICGETVSKRKSLAYKGGRACKSHEEVQAEAEKDRINKLSKKPAGRTVSERARKTFFVDQWAKTHCWVCRKEGVMSSKFWNEILFSSAAPLEDNIKSDRIVLIKFPFQNIKIHQEIDKRVLRKASSSGHIVTCVECAKQYIDPEFLVSAEANVSVDLLAGVNRKTVQQIEGYLI